MALLPFAPSNFVRTFGICLFAATLLSACSEGTGGGGGAGDFEDDPDAVALVTPLVGLYALPNNWAGFPGSEAYLEIQAPNNSGIAVARIFRVSSSENCVEAQTANSEGEVRKDPFFDRVLLDDVIELDNAILIDAGTNLTISLPEDIRDVDEDDDFDEPASLIATGLGIMASDLPATCV